MFKLSFKLPRRIAVAVSGGADSMASLDFLRRSHEVSVLHFNHRTPGSDDAASITADYCRNHDIDFVCKFLEGECPKGESLENFWREKRYEFFDIFTNDMPVVTCHHLDDVIETWLFSSLNGRPQVIPSRRGMYLRPFLQNKKSEFVEWCERKEISYYQDKSNFDTKFMRNYIRHEIVPRALEVNPGLHKVMRKKIVNDVNSGEF